MKHNSILTIASLLSILLMTLHLTSDTVHARVGTTEAGGSTLVAVPILVVWFTERWCSPNGGRGTSSCSSGRSLGWACLSWRFSRPDRQVQPSLLVRLDASRA